MKMIENKYTPADLHAMQSWSLERKIQVTQTRIIEWYIKHQGLVYVSFSGGKDSTVLLDLARRIYPDIPAVFVDTGLEYPEIRAFVKTVDNVTWLRPEMNFKKVIQNYGYPVVSKEVADAVSLAKRGFKDGIHKLRGENSHGVAVPFRKSFIKWAPLVDAPFMIGDECCAIMKKKPAKKYERESGRKAIIATMTCESAMRQTQWLRNGCNAFNSARPISTPMAFWREQDVLEYISHFKIPYSSIYGDIVMDSNGKYRTTGAARTGCMFCMFGVQCEKNPNRFQKMKVTHPKQYDFCMKPVSDGGLGLAEVLDYIGVEH